MKFVKLLKMKKMKKNANQISEIYMRKLIRHFQHQNGMNLRNTVIKTNDLEMDMLNHMVKKDSMKDL